MKPKLFKNISFKSFLIRMSNPHESELIQNILLILSIQRFDPSEPKPNSR